MIRTDHMRDSHPRLRIVGSGEKMREYLVISIGISAQIENHTGRRSQIFHLGIDVSHGRAVKIHVIDAIPEAFDRRMRVLTRESVPANDADIELSPGTAEVHRQCRARCASTDLARRAEQLPLWGAADERLGGSELLDGVATIGRNNDVAASDGIICALD